jgi:hypothetical protein
VGTGSAKASDYISTMVSKNLTGSGWAVVGRTRPVNCWTSVGKAHSRIGPGIDTTILGTSPVVSGSCGTECGCVRCDCVAMLRL